MSVIGPRILLLFLALATGAQFVWAQPPAGETDGEFYARMLRQAEAVNRDLTVSRERLTKVVAGFREELSRLESDRDKFQAELEETAGLLRRVQTQWQQLRMQASLLYRENNAYVSKWSKLQYEQLRSVDRAKKGTQ